MSSLIDSIDDDDAVHCNWWHDEWRQKKFFHNINKSVNEMPGRSIYLFSCSTTTSIDRHGRILELVRKTRPFLKKNNFYDLDNDYDYDND